MLLIAATYFLAGAQAGQTLADAIDRALPRPTGKNGYEEYVQAAKLVRTPYFSLYEGLYSPTGAAPSLPDNQPYPGFAELVDHLKGIGYLAQKREEVEKFAAALDAVRAGSQKPVFDPRPSFTPDTLLPEMAPFKSVSRLFASDSYVKFADGDSLGGTHSLMDALVFNYRISGGSIIASLVGVAGSAIIFRSFESRLPSLSVTDCQEIERISAQILAAPMGLKAGLEVERKSTSAALASALKSPDYLSKLSEEYGSSDGSFDSTKDVGNLMKDAQPADLARWTGETRDALSDYYRMVEGKLALPEAQWVGAEDDLSLVCQQRSPVAGALIELVVPAMDNVLMAIAKQRTQFRLLALHGKVLNFKWDHNKLPDRLEDAVDAADRHDPLSGRDFGYARKGDGYRLFSYGNRATGEIELSYRRPPDPGGGAAPP